MIVGTDDDPATAPYPCHKLQEGASDSVKVSIDIKMIRLQVCDYRNVWGER